jgi:hypothetical protein
MAIAALAIASMSVQGQTSVPPPAALDDTSVTLSADAEHYGAVFDKARPVQFYRMGYLAKGTLKSDYAVGGLTYQAGTEISFYQGGQVLSGTLKDDAAIGDFSYAKGAIRFHPNGSVASALVKTSFTHRNLVVTLAGSRVELNEQGRVASIAPPQGTPVYRLLGQSLKQPVELAFDERAGVYKLFRGYLAAPTLVAHIAPKRDNLGGPTVSEAFLVPADTTFQLLLNNPVYSAGQQSHDSYNYPGRLVIGGVDFGSNYPSVNVRDMRIVSVQIRQDLTIQGRQYKANDVVLFDQYGRVTHPPI